MASLTGLAIGSGIARGINDIMAEALQLLMQKYFLKQRQQFQASEAEKERQFQMGMWERNINRYALTGAINYSTKVNPEYSLKVGLKPIFNEIRNALLEGRAPNLPGATGEALTEEEYYKKIWGFNPKEFKFTESDKRIQRTLVAYGVNPEDVKLALMYQRLNFPIQILPERAKRAIPLTGDVKVSIGPGGEITGIQTQKDKVIKDLAFYFGLDKGYDAKKFNRYVDILKSQQIITSDKKGIIPGLAEAIGLRVNNIEALKNLVTNPATYISHYTALGMNPLAPKTQGQTLPQSTLPPQTQSPITQPQGGITYNLKTEEGFVKGIDNILLRIYGVKREELPSKRLAVINYFHKKYGSNFEMPETVTDFFNKYKTDFDEVLGVKTEF